MLRELFKPPIFKLHQSKTLPGQIVIIDLFGSLQIAKWRLMGDRLPVKYTTYLPTLEEIRSFNPSVVIMQLKDLCKTKELFDGLSKKMPGVAIVVTAKPENEGLLKYAFARGACSVMTLPLDLANLSNVCQRELKKVKLLLKEEKPLSAGPSKRNINIKFKRCNRPLTLRPEWEKNLLNTLDAGVLYMDLQGNILVANRAFNEIIGVEECKGRNISDILSDDRPLHLSIGTLIRQAMQDRQEIKDKEMMIPSCQVKQLQGLTSLRFVKSNEGEEIGLVTTIWLRSSQEGKEELMARSEKLAMVGQLAAGAAHEIKNPLTSVRGFIQLLQQELAGNPKAEYIDIIISEIDRVNNIVNEFLKLAKPAVPKRSSCSLIALFEEIRVLMESEAFLKNVVIEERYAQLPPVKIDKEQVKQVLINIIQNSFDAMPEGGRLTIQAEPVEEEKKIRIQFIDTGQGMDEEVLAKLFQPFFTTKEQGTGLGLSVSQQILESHGGKIEIESTPGEGTVTNIFLPYM